MKRLRRFALFAVGLGLCLAAAADASPKVSAADLVGLWYGRGYQPANDQITEWVIERSAEGTYYIEFRVTEGCQTEFWQVEKGRWHIVDGFYVVDTEWVNDAPSANRELYRIDSFDGSKFTYTHLGMGLTWSTVRTKDRLTKPACTS